MLGLENYPLTTIHCSLVPRGGLEPPTTLSGPADFETYHGTS